MLKNDFLCFMLLGSKEHSDCLKVDLHIYSSVNAKSQADNIESKI